MIKGKSIILKIKEGESYVAVAASTSCSLDIKRDNIEVASPTSGKWKEYKQTTMGATISVACLMVDSVYADRLNYAMASGEQIEWMMDETGDESCIYFGAAIIDSTSISGQVGSLAGLSFEMTVTGAISHHHVYRYSNIEHLAEHRMIDWDDSEEGNERYVLETNNLCYIGRSVIYLSQPAKLELLQDKSIGNSFYFAVLEGNDTDEIREAFKTDDEVVWLKDKGVTFCDGAAISTLQLAAGVWTIYTDIYTGSKRGIDIVTEL